MFSSHFSIAPSAHLSISFSMVFFMFQLHRSGTKRLPHRRFCVHHSTRDCPDLCGRTYCMFFRHRFPHSGCRCKLTPGTGLRMASAIVIAGPYDASKMFTCIYRIRKIHAFLCGSFYIYMGVVFRQKYSIGTPLFEDVGDEAQIREKRDAIFKLGSPTQERTRPGKVRVALFFIFAEYLWSDQMIWLFGGL